MAHASEDPECAEYVALELTVGVIGPAVAETCSRFRNFRLVSGNAAYISFHGEYSDGSISNCVLAHVDDLEHVLNDLRRPTRDEDSIASVMPCDPGLTNRLMKSVVCYGLMRNSGVDKPRPNFAREHRHGVGRLLELIKHLMKRDFI